MDNRDLYDPLTRRTFLTAAALISSGLVVRPTVHQSRPQRFTVPESTVLSVDGEVMTIPSVLGGDSIRPISSGTKLTFAYDPALYSPLDNPIILTPAGAIVPASATSGSPGSVDVFPDSSIPEGSKVIVASLSPHSFPQDLARDAELADSPPTLSAARSVKSKSAKELWTAACSVEWERRSWDANYVYYVPRCVTLRVLDGGAVPENVILRLTVDHRISSGAQLTRAWDGDGNALSVPASAAHGPGSTTLEVAVPANIPPLTINSFEIEWDEPGASLYGPFDTVVYPRVDVGERDRGGQRNSPSTSITRRDVLCDDHDVWLAQPV